MSPPPIPPKPEMPKEEGRLHFLSLLSVFKMLSFCSDRSLFFFPVSLRVSVVEEKVNEEAEKKKRREEYIRTYVSPWERAMKGNEELTATMKGCMPGPIQIHAELPLYKSFNRYTLNSFVDSFLN